jgi:hypothetical protein
MDLHNKILRGVLLASVLILPGFSLTGLAQSRAPVEKLIVSSTSHTATYAVVGDNIIFTLQAIDDLSDNIKGTYPNSDFAAIVVDKNQNGKVDDGVDVAYATWGHIHAICPYVLISTVSNRGCGSFASEAYLEYSFRKTEHKDKLHPVYKFTIPKSELLTKGKSADILIRFHSAGVGYTYYPERAGREYQSLSRTIRVKP